MADIQYLNYGDLQIELLALLNNLANNVQSYVLKLPWSNKRKEKFMMAYSDLMNKGLLGASNNTGQWIVNVNGEVDLDSMSRKDREMYQEAAYFIQLQMAELPIKANETEEKKDLPIFDNSTFQKGFLTLLSNDYFGGNSDMKISAWNEYDKRDDKTGLRPRTERAKMLVDSLERYAKTLKDTDYNFKDSPFGSLEEFNNRIANVRKALIDTPDDTDDDVKALNAIGINASDYFNNGSGDPFKTEGYEGTYGGYYNEYLPGLEKKKAAELAAKLKVEAEKQAAARKAALANQYKRFRFHTGIGVTPQDLAKYPDLISLLNGYNTGNQLTLQLKNELIGAFQFAAKNGQLQNLTKEELARFGSTYANSPNRLKKLPNLNGFYWDSAVGRVILPFAEVTLNFLDLVNLNGEEALHQKELTRTLSDGLTAADIADISAALTDTLGIGATFIPVVGNVAGAATGLLGSVGHFVGDVLRDGLDWGDAGNLALNAGFDLATLLPGLGTAAKAGKLAKALGPWVPRIIAGIGVMLGISNGGEIINSFKKLSNPSSMTVQDLQNISLGIALIAGGVNVTRGEIKLRLMKKATPNKEASVTTQKGQEVKLSESEYNTITSKNATRDAKNQVLLDAAKRLGIDLTNDGLVYKGRSITHPTRTSDKSVDVDLVKAPVQGAPTSVNISEIRKRDKEWLAKNRWAASILPGRTLNSKLNWTNNGIYTRRWKSLTNLQGTSNNGASTNGTTTSNGASGTSNNTSTGTSNNGASNTGLGRGASRKEYRDTIIKKRFSNNESKLKSGESEEFNLDAGNRNKYKFTITRRGDGNFDFKVDVKRPNGSGGTSSGVLATDIKYRMAQQIEQIVKDTNNTTKHKEIAAFIRKLKAAGYLKLGGTIDRQKIQKYKEFINK